MISNKIQWYYNRLKSMSLLELPYRFKQLVQTRIEYYKSESNLLRPIDFRLRYKKSQLHTDSYNASISYPATYNVFGKDIPLNDNINWHLDYFSNHSFPFKFGKLIDIRSNPNISAKNVWEINRFSFLPKMGLLAVDDDNGICFDQVIEILQSWNIANSFMKGINWYSNIEVNIRLINLVLLFEVFDNNSNDYFNQFSGLLTEMINEHVDFSIKNPSLYSSANNHLISEYSGLFVALSKFEVENKKYAGLLEHAKQGLETEIKKQHFKGANREEAAEYIQFITEFFVIPYVIGVNTNNIFSSDFNNTLYEIFSYMNQFLDIDGNYPRYGDDDDGHVIDIELCHRQNYFYSHLISAALIFEDPTFLRSSFEFDNRNFLLFGNKGELLFKELLNEVNDFERKSFFHESGHFYFKKGNKFKEIYCHYNVAELGYLSLAAHGHCDILSFQINVNGKEIFADSGTYNYHTSKEWRSYFLSSKAHNSITFDDLNPAIQLGDTMWSKHYKPKVLSYQNSCKFDSVMGTYDWYGEIKHSREISFDKEKNIFYLTDTINSKTKLESNIYIPFLLHPKADVEIKGNNEFVIKLEEVSIVLQCDKNLKFKLLTATDDSNLGWYSKRFNEKEKGKLIGFEGKVSLPLKINSKIIINEY